MSSKNIEIAIPPGARIFSALSDDTSFFLAEDSHRR
jgi:hypothetical protein